MSLLRKALILAAALLPPPAVAATQYIYRQITPSGAPAAVVDPAQSNGSGPLSVAAPAKVDVYAGGALSVPAPRVSNAASSPTWTLLKDERDIGSVLGTICPGMGFSAGTGAISGTPTVSCSMTLSYKVTVPGAPGQDPKTSFSAPFAFVVTVPAASVFPTSTSIRAGAAVSLSASTTLKSPVWTVTGQPAWMAFTASGTGYGGSGTSEQVRQVTTYPVVFTAREGGLSASATAYLTVEPAAASFKGTLATRGGSAFSIPLGDVAFESGAWTVAANPNDVNGLAISNGNLIGTAAANTGSSYVQHSVTASQPGTDPIHTILNVYPRLATSVFSSTVSGPVNQPYANYPNITPKNVIGKAQFTTSSLMPAGLVLDPNTGMFQGTPTEFGRFPVDVLLTDSYDNATVHTPIQLNIVSSQDIQFYQHESSYNYVIDFGNPGTGTGQMIKDVVIRNVGSADVQLTNYAATGDASDVDAFMISTGTYNGVPNTYTQAHSGAPAGQGDRGSLSPSPTKPCQAYLNKGYYCSVPLRFAGSSTGDKTGSFSITTNNGTSTIPLKGTTSGIVPGGSMLVTQPGYTTPVIGTARRMTVRYVIMGGGNAGATNGSYGGNSGVVAYGDTVTDASGRLGVTVGQGSATYQGSNGGGQATSNIGPVGNGFPFAYAAGATNAVGFASTGTFPSTSGSEQYNGGDGATGRNIPNGSVYGTVSGAVDARYGYPSGQPITAGFKLATIVLGAGGKGHAGITGCGANSGIRGGAGGGGGLNVMVGAPGGAQTLVTPATPAAPGAAFVHNIPGGGGAGFGAGGGGSETQTGACASGSPFFGAGGAGAGGFAYVEWDPQ